MIKRRTRAVGVTLIQPKGDIAAVVTHVDAASYEFKPGWRDRAIAFS